VFEVRPGSSAPTLTAPVQERYDAAIADGLVPQRRWASPRTWRGPSWPWARADFDYSTGLVVDVGGGLHDAEALSPWSMSRNTCYDDDRGRGHPDVRRAWPAANYFLLANGLIQAAVQHAPHRRRHAARTALMDPTG